jgi:hypothetical protein
MSWEKRAFVPVELAAEVTALTEHGRGGGWITAVLQTPSGDRLLGMRPVSSAGHDSDPRLVASIPAT